jgi:selenide,water dikinase
LPKSQERDERLLVPLESFDDAGVFRLTPDLAIVQTVDYFTPVVDDPRDWGRVAAANALSDVYAMGATPVTALNLLNFPTGHLDLAVAAEILQGGGEKVLEAGAVVLGGHSVQDEEPKYGLAVTGIVHPDRIVTNAGAVPGDVLVLTKPIGTGIITTALKRGYLSTAQIDLVTHTMATLNRTAMEAMVEVNAHAATDITGFGLLGHAWELACSSGVGLEIETAAIPVLEPTWEMLARGALPGGSRANRQYLADECAVQFSAGVSEEWKAVLTDANTSGGLLICVPEKDCQRLLTLLEKGRTLARSVVGRVVANHPKRILVNGH